MSRDPVAAHLVNDVDITALCRLDVNDGDSAVVVLRRDRQDSDSLPLQAWLDIRCICAVVVSEDFVVAREVCRLDPDVVRDAIVSVADEELDQAVMTAMIQNAFNIGLVVFSRLSLEDKKRST